jgi:flagellar hook protein FlgE|tara:strand:+ start:133 stop:915 length:783 start_codon:yes stop_codon:yes gene_type:complete
MLPVVRSGLSAASQEISVISNNIANASSLGFKRSTASFSDIYTEMSDVKNANRVGNGVRQEAPRRNHSQGSLILTGNALDLGMNGQGMFILNTAEKIGELAYTRNGAINIREDGKLVNSDGISYLDINSQEINLPFQIETPKGAQSLSEVKVTAEGFLEATYGIDEYVTIAQVGLARFADETQLKSLGDNIFTATPKSGEATIGAGKDFGFGKINAGSLEASNTDITAELTLLLRAQQAFNGSAKMMQADADVTRRLMDT